MVKRIIAVAMATLMLLTMYSCGNGNKNTTVETETDGSKGFRFYGSTDPVELGVPDKKIDVDSVMSSIEYTPEMFYGSRRLLGGKAAEKALPSEVGYYPDYTNEFGQQVSLLPFKIECGKHTINHMMCYIKEYNWIRLYVQSEKGNLDIIDCAYEIEGNKLKCTPLEAFEYKEETSSISYALADNCFEYEFKFIGLDLILSKDGKSVSLRAGLDVSDDDSYFHVDCYKSEGSEQFENILHIAWDWRTENDKKDNQIYIVDEEKKTNYGCAAELTENGLFTLTIPGEKENKTYQFVYFYGGSDGLIFTDGEKTYYYNDNYSDQYSNRLVDNLAAEDIKKLENADKKLLQELVNKKENLFEDLTNAFNKAGISVKVDEKNGEIAMDSSVLFGGDSAVITDDGKTLLNKFMSAYTSIIYNSKYDGFISKTVIEGHTAPVSGGTYESGLPLSEERANNVRNYCLSSNNGIDTSKLKATLGAVGYSNSKPIYSENGAVDMVASRRVSFKFIINVNS